MTSLMSLPDRSSADEALEKKTMTVMVQYGEYNLDKDKCRVSVSYGAPETFELSPETTFGTVAGRLSFF